MKNKAPSHSPTWLFLVGVTCFLGIAGVFVYVQMSPRTPTLVKHSPAPQAPTQRDKRSKPQPIKHRDPAPKTCNGYEELCDKPFDGIAQLGTWHSARNNPKQWRAPNQQTTIHQQLDFGVRVLHFRLRAPKGEAIVCGHTCQTGSTRFLPILHSIKAWIDRHPHDVLSILLDNQLPNTELLRVLTDTTMGKQAYAHAPAQSWPSLRQIRKQKKSVVLFVTRHIPSTPWLNPYKQHLWGTSTRVRSIRHIRCQPTFGIAGNGLYLFHFFLHNPTRIQRNAQLLHKEETAMQIAIKCKEKMGKTPNFVMTQMASIGSMKQVIKALNEL